MNAYSILNSRAPRIDAPAKATGQAVFIDDMKMPGMLYGALLQSPLAHARILDIDTSRAKKLPGVRDVITAEVLGIPLDMVRVFSGDTDYSVDLGAYSSRQTLMTGAAVGTSPAYGCSAQITEVRVDLETGQIFVEKMTDAHDCGFAINRSSVEGQMQGSLHMGLGEALMEESGHPDQVVEINCRYVDARDYTGVVLQARDRVEVLRVGCWGLRP